MPRSYYDEWAFLLDEERVNMLAMLAVGLESTLFAIKTDVESLNTVRTSTASLPTFQSSTPSNMVASVSSASG